MILFSSKSFITITAFITLLTISACSQESEQIVSGAVKAVVLNEQSIAVTTITDSATRLPLLDVYKSPTCSCCEKWLDHIGQHGFTSKAHNQIDLSTFKTDKGIAPQYRSCHTGVSKEGYIFEGHVPAKFIHQFLAKPPADAIGLSVPAMPIGTPGMEVGDKFMPYQVLLLMADGNYRIYAQLNNYQEQF
jgi:hypothetical protein